MIVVLGCLAFSVRGEKYHRRGGREANIRTFLSLQKLKNKKSQYRIKKTKTTNLNPVIDGLSSWVLLGKY